MKKSDNDYDMKPQEWLYRSNIMSFLRGCGVMVFAEMHTNKGRSYIVISHKGKTWLIELKVAYEGECPAKKPKKHYGKSKIIITQALILMRFVWGWLLMIR